jgi:endonuclease I
MRKLSLIIFTILSLILLVSCKQEVLTYSIDEVIHQIEINYVEGDSIDSVTQNITLPSESELMKYAQVIWSTSHVDIISRTGVVTRPSDDTVVTLTLNVSLKGETRNKTFLLTVKGINVYHDVYVIVFDEITSFRILEGSLFDEPEIVEFNNYRFNGWYLDEALTIPFDFDSNITSTTWIYAKYEAIIMMDVIINIYLEDIALLNYDLIDTIMINEEIGTMISYQAFFAGFELNIELSRTEGVVQNEPLILELYFDRMVFMITYVVDGLEYDYDFFSFEETIESIEDPEKQGYLFVGWSLEPYGELFDFNNTLTEDIILYAVFTDLLTYEGYYEGADGLFGNQLTTFLRSLLNRNVTALTYGEARYILNITDRDPKNSNNVILVYRGTSVSGEWDGGITWNREHVWPQSLLGVDTNNSSTHVGADLHNLKPANPSENSSRGNKFFDIATTTVSYLPRAEVRGDVARILFYMVARYDYLSLVNSNPITYQMAKLDTLLKWHLEDPVDDFERNRNNVIYQYQNNRNPFIDHPEFVEKIWGPITIKHQDSDTISILNLYRQEDIYFLDIQVYISKKEFDLM